MAYTFNLSLAQISNCDYISVVDTSTITDPNTRAEVCIALYWTKDNVFDGGDLANNGSAETPGEWFIPSSNGAFQITGFSVPQWDSADTYSAGEIVGDFDALGDGNFYVASQSVTSGLERPYQNPTHWDLLDTTEASFDIFNALNGIDSVVLESIISCNVYSFDKTGCLTYDIVDNTGNTDTKTYIIYDYKNSIVETGDMTNGENKLITLPSDGVYRFVVDTYEKVVIEWCNLRACVESMINTVINRCDDPCTEVCGDDCVNQINIFRNELNKVIALYYPLIAMIYSDATQNIGIFSVEEGTRDYAYKIGEMIDKLTVITTRCGLCSGAATSSTSSNTGCNC